jgi:hypothetical protein
MKWVGTSKVGEVYAFLCETCYRNGLYNQPENPKEPRGFLAKLKTPFRDVPNPRIQPTKIAALALIAKKKLIRNYPELTNSLRKIPIPADALAKSVVNPYNPSFMGWNSGGYSINTIESMC